MLLATTAIEETWGINEEILFLGEWCKLYSRKSNWQIRNSKTLTDPWSDRKRRSVAYEFSEKIYIEFLQLLSIRLNEFHKVNLPIRYWEILCGPWLNSFISNTYHKWECVSEALNQYHSIEIITIKDHIENQVPVDMKDFENKIMTDSWNQYISTLIVKLLNPEIPYKELSACATNFKEFSYFPYQAKWKIKLYDIVNFVVFLFSSKNTVAIKNPYLSPFMWVKLSIKLRSSPLFGDYRDPAAVYIYNKKFRRLKLRLKNNGFKSNYEAFLNNNLLSNIPFIYLEGFDALKQKVAKVYWPKNPRSIVTAVDQFSDDIFKCYSAEKVMGGAKYNIICHGGGGKMKYSSFQSLDLNLSDNYYTWGWSEYSEKCTKGNFIKDKHYNRTKNSNEQYILHIFYSKMRYQKFIDSTPSYEQYVNSYLVDQFKFINSLNNLTCVKNIIKLTHDNQNFLEHRINDNCLNVNFARIHDNYHELMINAKLVVTTYNATTLVESIAMNIPTIIFWRPEHWELAPSAIPFFNKLKECGVFHETPESAASMVEQVLGDIDGWWNSEAIQSACDEFRAWFARKSKDPIKELANFCKLS